MTRWLSQTVRPPVAWSIINFLSNTSTGYVQASNAVDNVVALLPLPLGLLKPILDIVDPIIDPLPIIGKGPPKARGEPLDAVKQILPVGKTLRAEGADEAATDGASEDPHSQPPVASTPANPPANCPCQGGSSVDPGADSTPLGALATDGSAGGADGGEGVSDSGEAM